MDTKRPSDGPPSAKLDIVQAVIAAWRAGDIDAVLEHMSDDIVWHYATAVAPPIMGKAKARTFLETFKSQLSAVRWRLFDWAERGDRLFVEGVDEYVDTKGAVIRAPYAGVLEFRGERICAWRDYVDVSVMDAQRAGRPTSDWVLALIDRPTA